LARNEVYRFELYHGFTIKRVGIGGLVLNRGKRERERERGRERGRESRMARNILVFK